MKKKRWPVDSWINFAGLASAEGYRLALIGAGADEELAARQIAASVKSGYVINAVGKLSMTELVQTIGLGGLMVSGDTGPMHIARALGIPVIGMFGPSLVKKRYMQSLYYVFFSGCGEVGCGKWQCAKPCLETISAEAMMSRVEDFFAEKLVTENVQSE